MSKVILKFIKSHGPYVAGDIAGFSPERARTLKSVAVAYDEDKLSDKNIKITVDTKEAQAMIDKARKDLEGQVKTIKEREKALEAREAEIAAREKAAVLQPEAKSKAANPKVAKGEPPAQGAGDTKASK